MQPARLPAAPADPRPYDPPVADPHVPMAPSAPRLPAAPPGPAFLGKREPEIEFLGKVVRCGLLALRGLFLLGGLAAIAGAVYLTFEPAAGASEPAPIPPLATRVATSTVWWCLGVPLLLPTGWLFGRGRWPMLAAGLALWFGPCWLEGDHSYGFVIRFFASFVAVSVLLVWRAVFALTRA